MLIEKIHVTNFLSNHDTEIDLSGISSIIAVGANGTGKSSLMVDAPLVALFGKGRSGDLDGYISNGKDIMTVEIGFCVADKHYRVIRKRSKKTARGSSTLEFFEIDAGNEISLTSGTIAETQETIEKTLGIDFDTLLRSSVLEQGGVDFFCKATPGERMELFSRVWDLEKYETMAQVARDTYNGLKIKIEAMENQIQTSRQRIAEANARVKDIEGLRSEIKAENSGIEALEKKRAGLQKKIGGFDNLQKEIEKAREYKARAEREIGEISEQHAQALSRIDRFEKILKNQGTVKEKVAEEERTKADIKKTEDIIREIDLEIESLRAEMEMARNDYQQRIDEVEIEQHGIETEIEDLRGKETAIQKVMAEVGRKEERLKHLAVDADKLKGVACHPDFDPGYVNETCRFIRDAVEAKKQIPVLSAEIQEEKARIGTETGTINTHLRAAEEKRAGCLSTIAQIKKSLFEANEATSGLILIKESARKGRLSEIDTLKQSLQEIGRYTKLLPEIDLAEKELPGLKTQEKGLADEANARVKERDKQAAEIVRLEDGLKGRMDLERELQSIATKLKEATEKKDGLTKRLGFIEAELNQAEVMRKQIEADEKSIEETAADRALYQILEDAFKQVPFMLISRQVGSVAKITNEILSIISQNGLTVEIQTERALKSSKKVRDEINLKITDQDGPKEYRFLSGGEKVRVAIALRLAISEVLAHRRGTRIDSLICDEPFNELDAEGVEDLKDAFRKLRDRFRFMAVISHISESKDTFPTHLVFSKQGGKSEVEMAWD